MKELWKVPILRNNLAISCTIWLLSGFDFFLITFYLKKFPGDIYVNSVCFALADASAFIAAGTILTYFKLSKGLQIAYAVSVTGGILYLVFSTNVELAPLFIFISRIGNTMSFNTCQISVSRLFPTKYVTSVYGIVNLVSHFITIGAPIVAELPFPIPFIVFCANNGVGIFAASLMRELDDVKEQKTIQ
jgi:hypothetical protein